MEACHLALSAPAVIANRAIYSACANGYDGSLMTSIIAMETFQSKFHTGDTGPTVAAIFSLYPVYVFLGGRY